MRAVATFVALTQIETLFCVFGTSRPGGCRPAGRKSWPRAENPHRGQKKAGNPDSRAENHERGQKRAGNPKSRAEYSGPRAEKGRKSGRKFQISRAGKGTEAPNPLFLWKRALHVRGQKILTAGRKPDRGQKRAARGQKKAARGQKKNARGQEMAEKGCPWAEKGCRGQKRAEKYCRDVLLAKKCLPFSARGACTLIFPVFGHSRKLPSAGTFCRRLSADRKCLPHPLSWAGNVCLRLCVGNKYSALPPPAVPRPLPVVSWFRVSPPPRPHPLPALLAVINLCLKIAEVKS